MQHLSLPLSSQEDELAYSINIILYFYDFCTSLSIFYRTLAAFFGMLAIDRPDTIFLDFSHENHIILIVENMGVRFCATLRNKVH
jgi:hypothetical protein